VLVVCSHLIAAFAPSVVVPNSEKDPLSFWYWPYIHAAAEGFPWVALFLVLSAFVNALKATKLLNAGQQSAALSVLATSSFRRSLRLMIPCGLMTLISWFICHLGAYRIAKSVNSGWLQNTTPTPSDSIYHAFQGLFRAIWDTWTVGSNFYDMNQWPMISFLRGSFALFLSLLIISHGNSTKRLIILSALFIFSWRNGDGNTQQIS
jgi:hypothetical protein